MQIRPNVYWFKGKASNIYLCADEDGLTVVDAGLWRDAKVILRLVEQLGYQPADIARILITHADFDHAGGTAAIHAASGAKVYASKLAKEHLRSGKSPAHLPRLVQRLTDRFFNYPPVPVAAIACVGDGDRLPVLGGMEVLATPGHTLDHLSFYSPQTGVLFAGDAIDSRSGRLNRSRRLITADEQLANRSAIRLLELAPTLLACGHGEPFAGHDAGTLAAFFDDLRQGF